MFEQKFDVRCIFRPSERCPGQNCYLYEQADSFQKFVLSLRKISPNPTMIGEFRQKLQEVLHQEGKDQLCSHVTHK